MKITKLFARQVFDSRGNPTIEVEAWCNHVRALAIVPSGASTGKYEALELRDKKKEYDGKGVSKAVENVNKIIAKKLVGTEFLDQKAIDTFLLQLDGTKNKSKLGANAILGVSMAAVRLGAKLRHEELYVYLASIAGTPQKNIRMPVPFSNIINGGKHAGSSLRMQEFMIAPVGAKNFVQAVQMCSETYHVLKKLLEEKYGKSATNVGDEGGFAPQMATPEQALDLITQAIAKAGYKGKVKIAMDPAASEFYDEKEGYYVMDRKYSKQEMIDYYVRLLKTYPIVSIEDAFDQDDFESFATLTAIATKMEVRIIGDDLTVSNVERIQMAITRKLCTALLLKVNQIGTVTEAIEAAKLAVSAGWSVMVSHRSGETEDTFIADLAVALGCGQIKLGAPCRTDRVCKYNRLLRISESKIPYEW
ncbi:MAG: phosphopyruvate hydratase [Candidatus Woesearchaeota archaeon]